MNRDLHHRAIANCKAAYRQRELDKRATWSDVRHNLFIGILNVIAICLIIGKDAVLLYLSHALIY